MVYDSIVHLKIRGLSCSTTHSFWNHVSRSQYIEWHINILASNFMIAFPGSWIAVADEKLLYMSLICMLNLIWANKIEWPHMDFTWILPCPISALTIPIEFNVYRHNGMFARGWWMLLSFLFLLLFSDGHLWNHLSITWWLCSFVESVSPFI